MQTTAATDSASTASVGERIPRVAKIKQVSASVATVIPEIGFDDEPISPVKRDETVTNKKPKPRTRTAPKIANSGFTSVINTPVNSTNKTRQPIRTVRS